MLKFLVVAGPTRPESHPHIEGRTVPCFADQLNDKLAELAEQGIVAPHVDCKPTAHGHVAYLSWDVEDDRLTLDIKTFAQRTGFGRSTITDMIARGEIPAVKHGRRYMIANSELAKFLSPSPR